MIDDSMSFLEPQVNQYGSHMVMTNVKKPITNKYVNIDTRYSNNVYKSTTSYHFTLPEKISSVKSLYIKSIEIPNLFYNISSTLKNNTFIIKNSNNETFLLSLDGGSYTDIQSIQTSLNSKLQLFTTDLTFSIDDTYHSHFTNSSSTISFEITFNTDESGNMDKYNLRSKLGWILGYDEISIKIPTHATNTSSFAVNLNTIRYLYLAVDEYSNNVNDNFVIPMNSYLMNKKIIAKIPLNNKLFPFGSMIYQTDSTILVSSKRFYKGITDVQKLNIELVNEWGMPIDLNGLDFSTTLVFSCE